MESCLVIAGEKSGEEHFLSFYPELKTILPNVNFFGVGGDEMASLGFDLTYHLKDFSSWGIGEVVHKIPYYLNAMKVLQNEVEKRNCKTAILIDFQDFNMRMAKALKRKGVKVLYYVAPQAWGWRPWRSKALAKNVHTLFTILPFEKEWFRQRGVKQVKGIAHPSFRVFGDKLESYIKSNQLPKRGEPIHITLLPGSRNFEVEQLLPSFIETVRILKHEHNIVTHLVKTSSVEDKYYSSYLSDIDQVHGHTDLVDVLKNTHVSLAASGTVTLATALFGVPSIVAYKASLFTLFVYNAFVPYRGPISLANLMHGEMVYPEFKQDEVQAIFMAKALNKWLSSESTYRKVVDKLNHTKNLAAGDNFNLSSYISNVIWEGK